MGGTNADVVDLSLLTSRAIGRVSARFCTTPKGLTVTGHFQLTRDNHGIQSSGGAGRFNSQFSPSDSTVVIWHGCCSCVRRTMQLELVLFNRSLSTFGWLIHALWQSLSLCGLRYSNRLVNLGLWNRRLSTFILDSYRDLWLSPDP